MTYMGAILPVKQHGERGFPEWLGSRALTDLGRQRLQHWPDVSVRLAASRP
jgi:hypothetical protein